ncbi:MAG: Flp family type IVb pilin [Methyloceanibacter sp.]
MRSVFTRYVKDERGTTAIEYGLIAAGLAVALLTAVQAVGGSIDTLFNQAAVDLTPKG